MAWQKRSSVPSWTLNVLCGYLMVTPYFSSKYSIVL